MPSPTFPPTFPEDFSLADYYLFDRLGEGLGGKTAVRYGARAYSYDGVAQRSRAFAARLVQRGVRRGERVLIVLPDTPPFVWTLFGTLARGAVLAMGNPDAPASSLEYLVGYTRATGIVTVPRVAAALAEAMRTRGIGREVQHVWVVPETATGDDPEAPSSGPRSGTASVGASEARSHSDMSGLGDRFVNLATDLAGAPTFEPVAVQRDEPAIWLFTSGSTGEPKANVHSHRDFAFNTEVYAKGTVGYAKDDVTISVPRLFFGYATGTNLLFPFAVGATAALFSERPTPESVAAAVALYRPSVVTNVPTMLGKLLEHDQSLRAKNEPPLDLSCIRFSLSAGEALPETLLTRWLERFGSDVYDGIGSAEMFHIYASNRPGDVKPGSLGKAVAGYELRVLPEEAEGPGAAPCAPGEIGVLWVKGDSVSHGYWLDRDKSWKVFHGHWCRTGDLFRVDRDGYLYFAGRADELIKVSGLWVAPVEVEECLMRHESVSLAAVIGIEEEGLTKPKAFIVLRSGVTHAHAELTLALQEHVKKTLAPHKYPRVIEFVSDVPKNDRGKVDRKALRAREAARGQERAAR